MKLLIAVLMAFLVGCASIDTSGFVEAEPIPYPHPGIYTGSLSNGILTYKINADGTGKTCFRDNYNAGQMMFGDLKYDGDKFHTEDGSAIIDSVSEERILAHYSFIKMNLRRVEKEPSNCSEFFR